MRADKEADIRPTRGPLGGPIEGPIQGAACKLEAIGISTSPFAKSKKHIRVASSTLDEHLLEGDE